MATDLSNAVDIRFEMAEMYTRWSEYLVDKLYQALDKYGIGVLDGPLWRSLERHVVMSGGDVEAVVLRFLKSGRFVDMQVGRGHPIGSPGPRRKKRWFSKTYYSQVQRLSAIYIKQYGNTVPFAIQDALNNSIELTS